VQNEQESQIETFTADSPRPVFPGDWAKADGHARQAHMTRIAAWKKATGQGQRATPDAPEARIAAVVGEREADVAALQGLIDAPGTLGSDRIRAIEAKQRILARQEEEAAQERHGGLVALRSALDALPTEHRVDALSTLLAVAPPSGQSPPAQGGEG
jgi:hypothetical protein